MKLFSKIAAVVLFAGAAVLSMGQANAAPVLSFNIADGGELTADTTIGGDGLVWTAVIDAVTFTANTGYVVSIEDVDATMTLTTGGAVSYDGSEAIFEGGSIVIEGAFQGEDVGVLLSADLTTTTLTDLIGSLQLLFFQAIDVAIADEVKTPFIDGPFDPIGDPENGGGTALVDSDLNKTTNGDVTILVPEPMSLGLLGLGLLGLGAVRRRKAA